MARNEDPGPVRAPVPPQAILCRGLLAPSVTARCCPPVPPAGHYPPCIRSGLSQEQPAAQDSVWLSLSMAQPGTISDLSTSVFIPGSWPHLLLCPWGSAPPGQSRCPHGFPEVKNHCVHPRFLAPPHHCPLLGRTWWLLIRLPNSPLPNRFPNFDLHMVV